MSVNDVNLLNLTLKKATTQQEIAENTIDSNIVTQQSNITSAFDGMNINLLSSSPTMDLCGNISDEEIIEYVNRIDGNNILVQNPEDDESNDVNEGEGVNPSRPMRAPSQNPANIAKIKMAIYDYRHPRITSSQNYQWLDYNNSSFTSYGWTYKTMSASSLYGGSFDSFYNVISTETGLTKTEGIPRSALFRLTQDDTNEDANMDLFGALNRAFADRAANGGPGGEDLITYKDLQLFYARLGGKDGSITYKEYINTVNEYADILEQEYKSLDEQGKFDFIIEKTQEYLEVADLKLQQYALTRLLNEEGTHNLYSDGAGRGQIQFSSNFSSDTTMGQYSSLYSPSKGMFNTDSSGSSTGPYRVTVFGSDNDTATYDLGITLNKVMLTGYDVDTGANGIYHKEFAWYNIVETMVHELTHATAAIFADLNYTTTSDYRPSEQGLLYLNKLGLITDAEYTNYRTNWDSIATERGPAYKRLMFLIDTVRGEYAAYHQSTNVIDAFGGDVFDGNEEVTTNTGKNLTSLSDMCMDGTRELDAIKAHIDNYYNTPSKTLAIPDEDKFYLYKNIGNLKDVGME